MRGCIDAVAGVLSGRRRRSAGDEGRMPRRLRPRASRSTFVPLREVSVLRGLARAA